MARSLKLKTPAGGTIRTVPINAFGSEAQTRAYLEGERQQWAACATALGRPDFRNLQIVEA